MVVPDAGTAANGVHVASGTGVLPRRTRNVVDVPAGACAFHDSAPQFTAVPASKIRDSNVPLGAYGLMRSQSTVTSPTPSRKLLAIGRIASAITIACVATIAPSTEYTT